MHKLQHNIQAAGEKLQQKGYEWKSKMGKKEDRQEDIDKAKMHEQKYYEEKHIAHKHQDTD